MVRSGEQARFASPPECGGVSNPFGRLARIADASCNSYPPIVFQVLLCFFPPYLALHLALREHEGDNVGTCLTVLQLMEVALS